MSKYKGLFTFDEDNHRYIPVAQADGIINPEGAMSELTPEEDQALNEAAKLTCAWETTYQTEEQ